MNTPREFTSEEIQQQFFEHLRSMIRYWHDQGVSRMDALDGLAFSFLVLLDQGNNELPGFQVLPAPHEEDMQFAKEQGENWYPQAQVETEFDIAGDLHDNFYHT